MYNDTGNPKVINCTFKGNSAKHGGGLDNGNSHLEVVNCSFTKNYADSWGGGISNSVSSIIVINCTFSENKSGSGGGMSNFDSNMILYNCIFQNNSSLREGGGLCNSRSANPAVMNCTFIGNSSAWGGGIFCYETSLTLTNCTLSGNSTNEGPGPPSPPPTILSGSSMFTDYALSNNIASAGLTGSGGGIECSKSSLVAIRCTFSNNLAGDGGGIHTFATSLELANCIFSGNLAEYGGGILNGQSIGRLTNCTFIGNRATHAGGMANAFSSTVLNNCKFNENLSTYDGGAVYNVVCSPTFMNCRFKGNAACKGGGMVNASSSPILKNCTFSNNSAENGGGMCNYIIRGHAVFDQSNPTLTNCIFIMNFASENGGGMCNNDKSHPMLTNCILWDDSPEEIYDDDSTTIVTYSNVQGGWGGEGNIDADPCFVDSANGDYHLLPDSPCIDTGDPNYIAEPNETDLDGRPRIINIRIDMGAYEFNHIPVAVAGEDQTIYAWIDGIAEVTLDGSGSFDNDGQPLTYLWNWTVDSNKFTVTEPNITIELPVGEYAIELVVNDGIDDSEPDEVIVTVVEALESQLLVLPRIINHRSRQKYILAWVRLPEGITKRQIDTDQPLLLYPGGVEALHQYTFQSRRRGVRQTNILAFFDKSGLMEAVPDSGQVELQAVGKLKTGQYFYGTDTIRIIGRRRMPRFLPKGKIKRESKLQSQTT